MVRAIVGANWGDKGKITDMLGEKSDIIVRFQGGSNAGHTIINDYGKFALHLLPSGVFYQHTTCVIGNGVALNIPYLQREIDDIVSKGVPKPHILVSDRAQILMPYHIDFDAYEEERLGGKAFGSTKSGIAPFYSDKYAKIGFQVSELFDADSLMTGPTMIRMVQAMQAHPEIGILQTPPQAVNKHTLIARVQQFANHLYGPVFAAGLHNWATPNTGAITPSSGSSPL